MEQNLPPDNWFESWFDTSYYHTLYKHRNLIEAKEFIEKLVQFLNLPKNSNVIDVACGKGRHSLTLSNLGFKVIGIDLSKESIAEAKKLNKENLQFLVHDMRLPFPVEPQDAAFNLFTSFGYFESFEENLNALSNIANSVKNNGILILDYLNAHQVSQNLVLKEEKEIDGISFLINRYIVNQKIIKKIALNNKNNEFKVFYEMVNALYLQDFRILFEKAGLEIMHLFGNYQLEKFDEKNSNRLILVAKKLSLK